MEWDSNPKGNESTVETHCPSTAEPSAGRQTAKQAVKVPCGFSRRTKGGAGKCDSEKNPANGAGRMEERSTKCSALFSASKTLNFQRSFCFSNDFT